MKIDKTIGVYNLIVGACMLGMWIFFYFSNSIPELESEPITIIFHLVAEIMTALVLCISGISMLKRHQYSDLLYYLSFGMLLYTLINSVGYFFYPVDLSMIVLFGILFIVSLSFFVIRVRGVYAK